MSKPTDNSNLSNPFSSPLSILLTLAILYFGVQYTDALNRLEKTNVRLEAQDEMIDKLRNFNNR